MNIESVFKWVQGIVKLRGATDNTLIGNVGDRLKVDTVISAFPTNSLQSWSSKLRFVDMNVANGGVARGTSVTNAAWTTVFSYTGSGYLAGALINVETFPDWRFRFLIDGADVFLDGNGILSDDITTDTIYDLDVDLDVSQLSMGLSKGSHDRLIYNPPLNTPVYFATNVSFMVRRAAGAANKKFQAGLVVMSKET